MLALSVVRGLVAGLAKGDRGLRDGDIVAGGL